MTKPFRFAWRKAVHRVGRRGVFLAFLATLDYILAFQTWVYTPSSMVRVFPVHVWASMWLVAGAVCTVGVVLRRDRVPYTVASAAKTCWAALWGYVAVVERLDYMWINAGFWFMFALIVVMVSSWPDPILTDMVHRRRE